MNTLNAKNISFGWEKNNLLFNDFSLSLENDKVTAIMGVSGCGKSTLLRVLAGLENFTGTVFSKNTKRKRPVMLFQSEQLFSWMTILENFEAAAKFSKNTISIELIDSILSSLGLNQNIKNLYPAQLSGGMLQRAAIARGLMSKPDIFLMDEPFSSLDLMTRRSVYKVVTKFIEENNTGVVLVTHSIDEALYMADRIIVLGGKPVDILLDYSVNFNRPRNKNLLYSENFHNAFSYLNKYIEGIHK